MCHRDDTVMSSLFSIGYFKFFVENEYRKNGLI